MSERQYVTIELREDSYIVAPRDGVRQKCSIGCRRLGQAWEIAERMAAAHGSCEIRASEDVRPYSRGR